MQALGKAWFGHQEEISSVVMVSKSKLNPGGLSFQRLSGLSLFLLASDQPRAGEKFHSGVRKTVMGQNYGMANEKQEPKIDYQKSMSSCTCILHWKGILAWGCLK